MNADEPAYPQGPDKSGKDQDGVTHHYWNARDSGLTKREYFAAQIAAGFAAQKDERIWNGEISDVAGILAWRKRTAECDAKYVCTLTDALIAELSKTP